MDLHERLSHAGAEISPRSDANGRDPFAQIKNRIHLSLVSELGPQLVDVDDSG